MSCCPPASPENTGFKPRRYQPSASAIKPACVAIPAGVGLIGTDKPFHRLDGEGPLRQKQVGAMSMSQGAITNAEFAAFVAETGYLTEAEHYGWSFVFWSQVAEWVGETQAVQSAQWWRKVDGSAWNSISGPGCKLVDELPDHPVIHISWNDAVAYCSWIGGRLPTELEWEHAARGGLTNDVMFPWGDAEPDDENNLLCNIWQGRFPQTNTVKDGYQTTAPSISFEPNGYGLYNMVGNVWDWIADPYNPPSRPGNPQLDSTVNDNRIAKGGSFLCHKSYCFRYRIAARIGNTMDSTTTHTGFRVVWDES